METVAKTNKGKRSFVAGKEYWYQSTKVLYSASAIILIILPMFVGNYTLHILTLTLIFAVLALSWNLVAGYSGIFSFGHHAFFGIGAYVSALLSIEYGLSPWFGLVIGGGIAAVSGIVISLPVLGLRAAPYIAILTLGFAEIVKLIVSNLVGLTRGELGLSGIEPFTSIGSISFNLAHRLNSYYLILAVMCLVVFVILKVISGPRGLALKSIRESQDAAESLGVNLRNSKLYVFMLSAFIAGVAGSFYAHYVQVLTPSSVLGVDIMMQILVITVIGGLGTIYRPIIGSFIVVMGLEYLRFLGDDRLMIYGVVLVLVIIFMPEGIIKKVFRKAK
jgi:branched-chain amino acid transport system permease protein